MTNQQIKVSEITRDVTLSLLEMVAVTTYQNHKYDELKSHIEKVVWEQGEKLVMLENQRVAEEKKVVSINYE